MTTYKIIRTRWLKRQRRTNLYNEVDSAFADHCLITVIEAGHEKDNEYQSTLHYVINIHSQNLYKAKPRPHNSELHITRARVKSWPLTQSILAAL